MNRVALLPVAAGSGYDVRQFGAVGDGVADDTAALQSAIDLASYGPERTAVVLPAGRFRITDTLQIGYGGGPSSPFSSVSVSGSGMVYRGRSDTFSGTVVEADFGDRPAINTGAGSRSTSLRRLTVLGRNFEHIGRHDLGARVRPDATLDDTLVKSWIDPALPASAASRHAPYAGVTIDAYAGESPHPAYPIPALPAWLGHIKPYGKAASSNVRLVEVMVVEFVVGLALKPSDADGNGDYTRLKVLLRPQCLRNQPR